MAKKASRTGQRDDLAAANSTRHPVHPVPQLQGPFEESILESTNNYDRQEKVDSITRRRQLLEREKYERTCAGRWRQRRGERFHPLWKLVAQISFGMHLLAQHLAKSEEEVMRILQTHVDEIDGFLERTTEDFELAQKDIQDRIQLLRVPLENLKIFDTMLEGREFRLSIVDGNEKIEYVVERTSRAMNDALKDVQKGIDSTKGLERYLAEMNMGWEQKTHGMQAVYEAMMSNVEGWNIAFLDLQMKGNGLGVALVQLRGIIGELQKRAGIASRRSLTSPLPLTHEPLRPGSPNKVLKIESPGTSDKPLPETPDPVEEAVQGTLPQRHPNHKAVRRISRNNPLNEANGRSQGGSQIRNSKSFPELSQLKLRHVAILDSRPSIRRRLSKKQRPVRVSAPPKPSPPAQDQPKNLARKSSFFSGKSTSSDVPKNSRPRLQNPASSYPPPISEPATPGSMLSSPVSETATSTSAAPAPFVPRCRPPTTLDLRTNASTITGRTFKGVPIVVVDDTETTASAPSESFVPAAERGDEKGDSITALSYRLPSHDQQLPLRRFLSSSEGTTSPRSPPANFKLFPVKSFENIKIIGEDSTRAAASSRRLPKSSSTPILVNQMVTSQVSDCRPPSPPPSFPSPRTPADSEKSPAKSTVFRSSPPDSPDSPDSFLTALPPLPLPPRNKKRKQAKSAVPDTMNTSNELLLLLASPPLSSSTAPSPISKRHNLPNPLRAHAVSSEPVQGDAKLDDEPRSWPPPPAPSGPAMVQKDFHIGAEVRKSESVGRKGLKRIFSRSQGPKRTTGIYIGGGDGRWFKGVDQDGAWVITEGRKK